MPAVTSLTSGVNAIAATVQTALTNSYLRKTSGNVVNADINASAAIVYSKLSVAAGDITPAKVSKSPYCLAFRSNASGTQAFGAADGTVSFSAALDNIGTMWAGGSPTRVTIPTTGSYRLAAAATIGGLVGATTDTWLVRKNGVTVVWQGSSTQAFGAELGVYSLTAADYLELFWDRIATSNADTSSTSTFLNPVPPAHFGALLVQFLGT